jgi:hypothetical protein
MLFNLLTAVLALALVAENVYIVAHRHPTNRFKPVEGYDGIVAFDSATGELCRTLRTKSIAEIQQSAAEDAKQANEKLKEDVGCPPYAPPPPSGDPIIDEVNGTSRKMNCGADGEDAIKRQRSDADSKLEFAVELPTCADIR